MRRFCAVSTIMVTTKNDVFLMNRRTYHTGLYHHQRTLGGTYVRFRAFRLQKFFVDLFPPGGSKFAYLLVDIYLIPLHCSLILVCSSYSTRRSSTGRVPHEKNTG